MKILKKIFLIFSIFFAITPSFSNEPTEFISEITQTASMILKENISVDEKAEKLVILAEKAVDIDGSNFRKLRFDDIYNWTLSYGYFKIIQKQTTQL